MKDKKIKQVSIEFFPRDMRNLGYQELIEGIQSVTVLSPVSLMPERSALIVIVKWTGKEDVSRWESYDLIDKVIDLGKVKDGWMYMLLGREEPWFYKMIQMIMEEMRVFFDWPVILEPDRIRIRLIGYHEDISKVMGLFRDFRMEETITSIIDYDPSLEGAMAKLTEKQHDALMKAYQRGYFDDRRKVTLNDLAEESGVSAPSYMLTLRRAVRKLITASMV
ncbi:MAG: helix-turn-helix domain-containing protein [Thermoplasmatota archaeon]